MRMQIEEAQESLAAKEREVRALTGKVHTAASEYEDATWRLERANGKIADVRTAAKQAEEELKAEIHELRGQATELTVSSRDAERRARNSEAVVEDTKTELNRAQTKMASLSDELSTLLSLIHI